MIRDITAHISLHSHSQLPGHCLFENGPGKQKQWFSLAEKPENQLE